MEETPVFYRLHVGSTNRRGHEIYLALMLVFVAVWGLC